MRRSYGHKSLVECCLAQAADAALRRFVPQMWGDQRAAPPAASLPELYTDAGLLPALAACLLPPGLPLDASQPMRLSSSAALFLLGEGL